MSMNLEGRRWWVMAMAVLLGADTAATLADDAPPAAAPAAQIAPDRSAGAIDQAVADLAHADPATRDAAAARLLAIGKPARPALAAAAKGEDPEAAARAKALLAKLTVPLAITLTAPTTAVKAGQPFPPVTINLRNASDLPLTVMAPIDGCDVGWRVVRYEWVVTDAAGQPVPRRGLGRCGNTNALAAADFVDLAPDKSVTLEPGKTFLGQPASYFALDKPGTYKVALRYAFDPNHAEKGLALGRADDQTQALLAKVRVTDVTSNALTIEVRE